MVLVYVVPQCVILEDVVTAQTLEKVKTCHWPRSEMQLDKETRAHSWDQTFCCCWTFFLLKTVLNQPEVKPCCLCACLCLCFSVPLWATTVYTGFLLFLCPSQTKTLCQQQQRQTPKKATEVMWRRHSQQGVKGGTLIKHILLRFPSTFSHFTPPTMFHLISFFIHSTRSNVIAATTLFRLTVSLSKGY